jgi:hypothetical protein
LVRVADIDIPRQQREGEEKASVVTADEEAMNLNSNKNI